MGDGGDRLPERNSSATVGTGRASGSAGADVKAGTDEGVARRGLPTAGNRGLRLDSVPSARLYPWAS
jgi:hypothetical protein